MEKKRSESKSIKQLNVNDRIVTSTSDILNEQKVFYEHLYNKKQYTNSQYDFFNNNINILNEIDKNSCEGCISEHVCLLALKEKKNNKSPGSDGISTEFYKIFWNDIKLYYVNSLNYSFQNGDLTDLQKQSVITLLPKTDKDTCFLKNWRPISLLNVDYKIATKAIANRIKKVITNIVSNAQTGFIKGRYIGENIRLLYEVLD